MLALRIDKTADDDLQRRPERAPGRPNHQMIPVTAVTAVVTVTDAGSGSAGFTDVGHRSEPDLGLGDGDRSNDIQAFTIGEPGGSGQLRAERSGPRERPHLHADVDRSRRRREFSDECGDGNRAARPQAIESC